MYLIAKKNNISNSVLNMFLASIIMKIFAIVVINSVSTAKQYILQSKLNMHILYNIIIIH